MKFNEFIKTVFLTEILKGLALTLKSLFTRPVTRQYPEEKRVAMPGYRGLHALVREESTGKERCIACGLCAAVCPSQCISIHTAESPEHVKVAERYEIDVLRCLFCGFCVEACPVGAVVLTEHFEYAAYSREALIMNKERLLENWDTYMAGDKGKEYLKRFWLPRPNELETYEGQAVFKPSARTVEK
jgi:NADH-quinone oxidoreductase subunit I